MLAETSIISNVFVDVIAGLVVLIVPAATTSALRRERKKRDDKKEDEASTRSMVEDMHKALVGEEPTPLNPSPPPGALKVIADVAQRTTRIEHTLFENGGRNNTILDRLGRIEQGAVEGSRSSQRVEDRQTSLEVERQERDSGSQ